MSLKNTNTNYETQKSAHFLVVRKKSATIEGSEIELRKKGRTKTDKKGNKRERKKFRRRNGSHKEHKDSLSC